VEEILTGKASGKKPRLSALTIYKRMNDGVVSTAEASRHTSETSTHYPQQSENSVESQEENSDNLNPDSSAKVVAQVSHVLNSRTRMIFPMFFDEFLCA